MVLYISPTQVASLQENAENWDVFQKTRDEGEDDLIVGIVLLKIVKVCNIILFWDLVWVIIIQIY